MAARIRKDDVVVVISGDHKGAKGKVLRIIREDERVVVEGVNMVWRHVRKSQRHPQGGRIQKEAALPLSKVQPIDPKTGRGTRVRYEIKRGAKGEIVSKHRMSAGKKSAGGSVISEVTSSRGKTARTGQ